MQDDQRYRGDPWTTGAEIKLRAEGGNGVTLITLLTDEAGAHLIAQGVVPAYVKEQCVRALEWCCVDERTPEHERLPLEEEGR